MYQRILVTDDDPILRSLYKMMLRNTDGFLRIDFAATKKEAMERICIGTYDLALIDIDLGESEVDGFDLLVALKSRRDDTKVMMMSSMLPEKVESRCMSLGAAGFTPKDIHLIENLKSWLTVEVAENYFEHRHLMMHA